VIVLPVNALMAPPALVVKEIVACIALLAAMRSANATTKDVLDVMTLSPIWPVAWFTQVVSFSVLRAMPFDVPDVVRLSLEQELPL
jgi:hypothetical protein